MPLTSLLRPARISIAIMLGIVALWSHRPGAAREVSSQGRYMETMSGAFWRRQSSRVKDCCTGSKMKVFPSELATDNGQRR